jgi:hypothetical protein
VAARRRRQRRRAGDGGGEDGRVDAERVADDGDRSVASARRQCFVGQGVCANTKKI